MLSFCDHFEQNTQAIFFYALIFKIIKFKNRKFEYDIFSISLNLTSSEKRRENEFFKSEFELHEN